MIDGPAAKPAVATGQPRPEGERLPLSLSQQRLWILDRLDPGQSKYNVPLAMHLRGRLHRESLRQTLTEIVRRHEVLRTAYPEMDGEPAAVVRPNRDVAASCIDLTSIPEATRWSAVEKWIEQEAWRPFDLAVGPLFRCFLFHLDAEHEVLLLVFHHIIFDGWSTGVLRRELRQIYEAYTSGRPSPLPELPVQYVDIAASQRKEWSQTARAQELRYWKEKLAGVQVLDLPTDHPRPAMASHAGATQDFYLPADLVSQLKMLARRLEVTLFMLLLAAWKVLLSRYSGQRDLVVGSPVAGRPTLETNQLIGFFVNTLTFRTDLSGVDHFLEVVRRVRQTVVGAFAHQGVPFEKVVEHVSGPRDASRHPLFQVMFALQNLPNQSLRLQDVTVEPVVIKSSHAKFDLSMLIAERGDQLKCWLEYDTSLFDASTIERITSHFQQLLEGLAADPNQRIDELPLLSDEERRQLLVEWNDTAADYPRDQCIHQLFEAQAARTPKAVAVVFEDRQLTYAELNARANQLAHHLRELGVGPEVRVGLCVERSLEMVVGLLGILKAGGAYVPLDPDYPAERLAFMLEDTQAPVLLTQQALLERLPAHHAHVVGLDADWNQIDQKPDGNLPVQTNVGNLAYVIYTSGSTGQPKGVAVHHGGLVASTVSRSTRYEQWPESFILLPGIAFDAALATVFWTLTKSGALIIPTEDVANDIEALGTLVDRHRVTNWLSTTSQYAALLQHGTGKLDSLRTVVVGGEELPASLIARHRDRLPHAELFNEYGATEGCIWSAVFDCRTSSAVHQVPIGRAIANTQLYVLDHRQQPVPVNVAGELHIGGAGLARGYLDRPELTAEKFIPNPFHDVPGSRLYRTGDLCRWLPDGNLEFLGRLDHQVKLRGFRIELGEIEAALNEHPSVARSVAMLRQDTPDDKRLVAYYVTAVNGGVPAAELGPYLRSRLPEYMVPSAIIALNEFPLTGNGKIDRGALPALGDLRPELERTYVAPRNATESLVAEIWANVFRLERVGIHDNFFDLGGHSLLATHLTSRLNQRLQLNIPLRTVFESPTIALTSQVIDELLLREIAALGDDEVEQLTRLDASR